MVDFGWFVAFESIKIVRVKVDWNCYFVGLLHHPFSFSLFRHFWVIIIQLLNYFVWLRITHEGSVPEMRIWSILLIGSGLKWCKHRSRSLISYCRHERVAVKVNLRPENDTNYSNTYRVITILIHYDKRNFKTFLLCCYVAFSFCPFD